MFVLLTTSERPSLQAFWKRACLSSWGRSLKPVYLIYREKNTYMFIKLNLIWHLH